MADTQNEIVSLSAGLPARLACVGSLRSALGSSELGRGHDYRRSPQDGQRQHAYDGPRRTARPAQAAACDDSPYVFTTERGGPLSVRALQYIVAEAGKQAGLPEELSHPHALRHAAGYSLINSDVDVRLVQEFLGHKTPAMTMHYTAVSPKRLAALRVR